MRLQQFFERRWYGKPGVLYALYPLACLYRFLSRRRRKKQRELCQTHVTPVVVVGNILVGGTGKTPVIIALARRLKARGVHVGIVSRGYGRSADAVKHEPVYRVSDSSTAEQAGDEPLEMYRALGCPVVVAVDRAAAVNALTHQCDPDLILSDDGLQHYTLNRQIEIAVFNQAQGLGNGHVLPVGPLREPADRLHDVDFVLVNCALESENAEHKSVCLLRAFSCYEFSIKPMQWVHVNNGKVDSLSNIVGQRVCAFAGIGQPKKFFDLLGILGGDELKAITTCIPKPDHTTYTQHDFHGTQYDTFLMTAKDAVKCRGMAPENSWYLLVDAVLPETFIDAFMKKLEPFLTKAIT